MYVQHTSCMLLMPLTNPTSTSWRSGRNEHTLQNIHIIVMKEPVTNEYHALCRRIMKLIKPNQTTPLFRCLHILAHNTYLIH